ncbi:unnamed protein product [Periconia digitata]|uniref:Uncharacterized protein n=1 Tax=Periconia digitata TaxID=1303443 RepID=A0A9W4UKL1_9PLEO|nr:unnamed protein product [Periconia digitata]
MHRSKPLRLAFQLHIRDYSKASWAILQLLLLTFRVNPDCLQMLPASSELARQSNWPPLTRLLEVFQKCRTAQECNDPSFSRFDW